MIPYFPIFKKLELKDKETIENIIKQYPPYSDYNFVSLWSYNTKESIEISLLNENLAVKFVDYFGIEHFYSFLGNKKVEDTIKTLLSHSNVNNVGKELILIPEINISSNTKISKNFLVIEDLDNFDYVLSVQEISKLTGNKYGAKRNFVNRFIKNYPETTAATFDLKNKDIQQQIEKLFFLWEKLSNKTRSETENELTSIRRLLKSAAAFNLVSIGLFTKNKLVAFSINEVLHDNYAIIHFEKADTSFIGIFQYLKQQTAIHLEKLGCKYINYEQDLGIPGLRKSKEQWNPVRFLKKYTISHKG